MAEDTATSSAVADAPVSAPSAPSGESSAPASPPTPAAPSKPTSMQEAFAQTAAKRAAKGDAAATVPPAPGDLTKKGPIPFEVHETTLKNARDKTRAEVLAELEPQIGWARSVTPQDFEGLKQVGRHFKDGNAIAGLQSLIEEFRKDPAIDAQLRSFHAKALSAARGQSTASDEPALDMVRVQLEDGRLVNFPTAESLAKRDAWIQQQAVQQALQQMQPLVQTLQTLDQDRQVAQFIQQRDAFADGQFADVQTWPGMDDKANHKLVAEKMATMRIEPNDPRAITLALHQAWREVIAPKLVQQGSAAQLASLKQKAVAQTESPSAAATTMPARPRTPQELAKFMAAKAAQRGSR